MLCAPSSPRGRSEGQGCVVLAVLAPGQGAQTPGMLAPWLDLAGVDTAIEQFSEVAGLDLRRLGTTADADEIKDTAVTQPLIVALGLIVASQLELGADTVVAGHSVGELTAAAVAGVLSPRDAVALAARRGAEMAAACALVPTGMTAVLGGDPDAGGRRDRGRRPHSGQPQRRRADRRRGRRRAAGGVRGRTRPPARVCGRSRSPARSTPPTWRPRRPRSPRCVDDARGQPTRRTSCCRTPTARPRRPGAT